MSVTVAAFYRFTPLADAPALRLDLKARLALLDLCGILLVAPEGINGTLAGSDEAIEAMLALLREKTDLCRDEVKFSQNRERPFKRLRVRLKKEIITFKQPAANSALQVGAYVTAKDWDNLVSQPDVLLLDTRNRYETMLGRFEGALDPNINHFTEFAEFVRANLDPKKHKKVAMFCTGGIRCEKASAFMLAEGFEEVYHLKGGILKYLEEIPPEKSSWQGSCFVFDHRVALEHGLTPIENAL
jgi:UPF0176 protein